MLVYVSKYTRERERNIESFTPICIFFILCARKVRSELNEIKTSVKKNNNNNFFVILLRLKLF